jgi:hypothetical protein
VAVSAVDEILAQGDKPRVVVFISLANIAGAFIREMARRNITFVQYIFLSWTTGEALASTIGLSTLNKLNFELNSSVIISQVMPLPTQATTVGRYKFVFVFPPFSHTDFFLGGGLLNSL